MNDDIQDHMSDNLFAVPFKMVFPPDESANEEYNHLNIYYDYFTHPTLNSFAANPSSYFSAVKPRAFFRAIFFESSYPPKVLCYRAKFCLFFFFCQSQNFCLEP